MLDTRTCARLAIVGSVISPLLIMMLCHNEIDEEPILFLIIPIFVLTIYWAIVYVALWFLDGFKQGKYLINYSTISTNMEYTNNEEECFSPNNSFRAPLTLNYLSKQ